MIKIIKLDPDRFLEAKEIRIEAMKTDPESFSSKLEDVLKLSDDKWKERLRKSLINKGSFTYYAEFDGDIVGMVGSILLDDRAELFGIYVKPEFRGKKIGFKLLSKIFETLKTDLDIKKVFLYVNISQLPAVNLYKKIGFKVIDIKPRHYEKFGKFFDTYLMEMILN